MGGRTILRSDARHGDAADGRRFQRLLLDPARTAERTGRSAGGPAGDGGHDAGELSALVRNKSQASSFSDVRMHIVDAPLGAGPESILTIVVVDSQMCNCTS